LKRKAFSLFTRKVGIFTSDYIMDGRLLPFMGVNTSFFIRIWEDLKMKNFKKISCVFLAVLLVTGTIAVSLAVDNQISEPPLKVEITTDKSQIALIKE